jgi:hypothetical protein
VTDTERIEHLADRVRDLLAGESILYQTVPIAMRSERATKPASAEADLSTLLRTFATSRGLSVPDVEALVALWHTASADDEADLGAEAAAALAAALDERPVAEPPVVVPRPANRSRGRPRKR